MKCRPQAIFTFILLVAGAIGAGLYFYIPPSSPLIAVDLSQPTKVENDKHSNGKDEDPFGRAAYEYRRYIDPATGRIPDNIRIKELIFSRSNQRMDQLLRVADSWDHRGPYNVGGRTRALAVKQSDGSVIMAGGASGGMWRSSDSGSSWTKTTGVSDLQSVTAITEDLYNSGTWYYATGEYKGNSASGGNATYNGNGIFKSTDDGLSWTLLSATSSNTPQSFDNLFDYIWDVAVDPNTGYIYAAIYGAIYRSTNGGTSFSVVIGGYGDSPNFCRYTDVDIVDIGSSTVLYAVMSTGTSQGVYRSTNGSSWTDISSGSSYPTSHDRAVLAVAPSNDSIVYIIGNDGSGDALSDHFLWKYHYLSGDGSGAGGSWTDLSANLPAYGGSVGDFKSQYGYDLILSVKPDDANMVFIGGTNLYRSSDGFATAPDSDPTNVSNIRWIGGYSTLNNVSKYSNHHPDIHSIAFDPSDPTIMYAGHDGGISKTTDNTANGSGHEPVTWSSLNNGYMTTQFYAVAFHPAHYTESDTYYDYVMGGMQDNGTWGINSTNPDNDWTELNSGDGGFCYLASDGTSYRSSQYGWIFRYSSPVATGSRTVVDPDYPSSGPGLFINPFELDPNNDSIMYNAYGAAIYRNDNVSGATPSGSWTELTSVTSAIPANHKVTALSVSKSPANTVYFGTTDMNSASGVKIFRIDSANAGAAPTVTDLTASPLPAGNGVYASCIAIDPADADHILVAFSNYSTKSVFHSNDAGASFTDVSGDLEQNADGSGNGPAVNWAAITNHASLETYFVGTSTGLYSTSTLNGTSTVWQQEGGSNLGNVVVDMVRIREEDGLVLVATHANGVYCYRPPSTSNAEISFVIESQSVTEMTAVAASGSLCSGYRDYTVSMQIANPPTGDAIVTLSTAAATIADEGLDFNFTTNGDFDSPDTDLTFSDGSTANQTFTVRIYDDAEQELTDSIVFQYSISGTTDAISGSSKQTHTIRINDDDDAPVANETITFFEDDFESGSGSWSPYNFGGHNGSSPNAWRCGTQIPINGSSLYVSEAAGSSSYDKTMANDMGIYSTKITTTGYSDIDLTFNYQCNGQSGTDYGLLGYRIEGEGTVYFIESYQGVSSTTARSITLPAALNDTEFYLWWRWISNTSGGSDPAFVVDDIVISKTITGSDVETQVTASATEYLGPNATVHYYDETSGALIGSIENLGSHDYGCTELVVESEGDTARLSWNDGDTAKLAAKTVRVLPSNNSVTGDYNITLYYTADEINGWMTATGKGLSDIKVAKTSGSMANVDPDDPGTGNVISPATIETFGANYKVTASFSTGFSGFGIGDPGVPPSGPLPVELLTFTGRPDNGDIILEWTTTEEVNSMHFEIQRSSDGTNFENVGIVTAAGTATIAKNYRFVDRRLNFDTYFYRLKIVDLDGSFEYSSLVSVTIKSKIEDLQAYPNPTDDILHVDLYNETAGHLQYDIYNLNGKKLKTASWYVQKGRNSRPISVLDLEPGMYILCLRDGTNPQTFKFFRSN